MRSHRYSERKVFIVAILPRRFPADNVHRQPETQKPSVTRDTTNGKEQYAGNLILRCIGEFFLTTICLAIEYRLSRHAIVANNYVLFHRRQRSARVKYNWKKQIHKRKGKSCGGFEKYIKSRLYEGSLRVLINFCCPRSHLLTQPLSFRSYFHIEIKARGKIGVCRGRGRWTSKSSNPSLSYDPLFYYLLFFFFLFWSVSLFFFLSFSGFNMTSRYSRV